MEDQILHPLSGLWGGRLFLAFTEAPLVIDDHPGFFFVDRGGDQGDHAGSGAAVLDDPEQLAIFPLLVELAVGEVPGARIEDRAGRTVAFSFFTMAVKAGALAFK